MPHLTPDPAATVELPTVNTDWPVIARTTIMDGLCIEWYRSVKAYESGGAHWVSVSRDGVFVYGNLLDVPDAILDQARRAHELLATRRDSDRTQAQAMATHRSIGRTRQLQPIERSGQETT